MSYTRNLGFLEKLRKTRSWKGFMFNFLKPSMRGQKAILFNPSLPRVLNISFLDKTCFYKCVFCPYSLEDVRDAKKEPVPMTMETLKNIVGSVPNDPFFSFDISSFGETLEFDQLTEYIEYMKRERPLVNTVVSTNGLLLDNAMSRGIIESGLDNLQISLFAENEEDYRTLCGGSGYNKVCENIDAFMAMKKRMGSAKPFTQVFMFSAVEFAGRVDAFYERWSGVVDAVFTRPLYNATMSYVGLTPTHAVSEKRYPCISPWYSTSISANGDVGACYMFNFRGGEEPVGNVNERPLVEIWRGDKMNEIRQAHLSKNWDKYGLCAACDLWDAYTNIWRDEGDRFAYRPSLRDWITPALGEYRGA